MEPGFEKFRPALKFQVTVIVLNYNGQQWLKRCLDSIRDQTIFKDLEVIVADNNSPDGSGRLAEELMSGWENGRLLKNSGNLGFAAGNNLPASQAQGEYLFFLNNDAWLEPECLQVLMAAVKQNGAAAACPLILNYEDDSFQSAGALGFDVFGLPTSRIPVTNVHTVLMPEGCGYLIKRDLFIALGGFDPEFFMFAEEYDLSWRIWIAGETACIAPKARMHHRGAAQVNPQGGDQVLEFRTSDRKRFYANRNCLLVLLKSAQHVLFLALLLQLILLGFEAVVALVVVRRWSFVRQAYLAAIGDCWRLRSHIHGQRASIKKFRKRGDFAMLRFFRLPLNRWTELTRMLKHGAPKITPG